MSVTVSDRIAREALDAILVRVRWYECRRYAVPLDIHEAMAAFAKALGVDVRSL